MLSEVLMIGLMAVVCDGDEYSGMPIFAKVHEERLRTLLKLPNGIPYQDTFECVFQNVNPKCLAVPFKSWPDDIKETMRQSGSKVSVSVDGKAIRGSKRAGSKAVHVVTALVSEFGLVLGEMAVDKKSNEITVIPELFEMFCSTAIDGFSNPGDWIGIAGFGVIISKREVVGKELAVSHNRFIFSFKGADAAGLLRLKRSHWAIENNLHWMLDVVFREDASCVTLGNSTQPKILT